MRVNEFVRQVQQGARVPEVNLTFGDTRETPETRAERRDSDESRRTAPRVGTTRMPRRYGAGF